MSRGMTLVELVVVLAITGISALVAVPALSRFLEDEPAGASPVVELLARARRTSLERGLPVTVTILPGVARYWVWIEAGESRTVVAEGLLALPPGVRLSATGARATFRFAPSGSGAGVYADQPNVPEYLIRNDTLYRLITDHLGSVRLVLNVADGTVVQRMSFDESGREVSNTNPGFQPFGYAGGLIQPETGLIRFGVRDYDPTNGRWTTKDPAGLQGTDVNLYLYADADPINWIDPTGEMPWGVILAAADLLLQLYQSGGDWQCVNWGEIGLSLLGGGLLNGLLKGAFKIKAGSKIFNANWRRWFRRNVRDYNGSTHNLHHWLLERNQGIGRFFRDWVKNQPWNVNVIPRWFNNWLASRPGLAWLGAPSWAPETVGGVALSAGGPDPGCACR